MFHTNCTNKGCYKQNVPVLDKKTNEVFCSECGNVIQNISSFAKHQMITFGQIKKPVKTAYSIKCLKCKTEARPVLNDKNVFVCVGCSNPSNISKPFENLLRDVLKKGDDEI